MEDLQIAITPARVDQRNFGLWLKSWQVGQVLQALVADKLPSGDLVLRIGAQQITATADIPVQKGAVLMLEVTGLHPIPRLKIVNASTSATLLGALATNALGGQLQLLVPRHGRVVDPLITLLNPAHGANILALLGVKSDALERLLRSVTPLDLLADSRALRQAVGRSGLFLETQLLRSGGVVPQGDIKALLLRLLDRVNRTLGRRADNHGSTGDRGALLRLRGELEGAMATITLNQLVACQVSEQGSCVWLVDIPYHLQGAVQGLTLQIERDGGSAQADGGRQDWKVSLNVTLPQLGSIQAELFLRGDKVSVVIYSEQAATARLMDSQLPTLKDALRSRGLDVSVLLGHRGNRSEQVSNVEWRNYVDENV